MDYLRAGQVGYSESVPFSSVTQSCSSLCDPMDCSLSITNSHSLLNLYPSSRWCHPTISSSFVPFFSCLQSLPASGSFPVSQFFASGVQSIGASASGSVLPMNTQHWFPLDGLVGSPSCPRDSQESSPVPQFESINSSALCLLYGPALIGQYMTTGKTIALTCTDLCWQSDVFAF